MLVVKLQKLQKAPPNGLKIEIITRPERKHVTDKIQRQDRETFTISAVALKQTRGKDQLLPAKRKRTNPNFF